MKLSEQDLGEPRKGRWIQSPSVSERHGNPPQSHMCQRGEETQVTDEGSDRHLKRTFQKPKEEPSTPQPYNTLKMGLCFCFLPQSTLCYHVKTLSALDPSLSPSAFQLSPSCGPLPTASVSAGSLLGMQSLWPHLRTAEAEPALYQMPRIDGEALEKSWPACTQTWVSSRPVSPGSQSSFSSIPVRHLPGLLG